MPKGIALSNYALSALSYVYHKYKIATKKPPPISCTENKYIPSFMAMCLRYMQSFQLHFVPRLRSFRNTHSLRSPALHFTFILCKHLSTARLRQFLPSHTAGSIKSVRNYPSLFSTHFQWHVFIFYGELATKNKYPLCPTCSFYRHFAQLYFINFGCGRAFHFGSIALCELQFTFLRTPCTTYAFIFFHYHIARHKKCFNFNALYQRFATTYATFQHNSNGLFFLNATSWSKDYISTK